MYPKCEAKAYRTASFQITTSNSCIQHCISHTREIKCSWLLCWTSASVALLPTACKNALQTLGSHVNGFPAELSLLCWWKAAELLSSLKAESCPHSFPTVLSFLSKLERFIYLPNLQCRTVPPAKLKRKHQVCAICWGSCYFMEPCCIWISQLRLNLPLSRKPC